MRPQVSAVRFWGTPSLSTFLPLKQSSHPKLGISTPSFLIPVFPGTVKPSPVQTEAEPAEKTLFSVRLGRETGFLKQQIHVFFWMFCLDFKVDQNREQDYLWAPGRGCSGRSRWPSGWSVGAAGPRCGSAWSGIPPGAAGPAGRLRKRRKRVIIG